MSEKLRYAIYLGDKEIYGHGCHSKAEMDHWVNSLSGEIRKVPVTEEELTTYMRHYIVLVE